MDSNRYCVRDYDYPTCFTALYKGVIMNTYAVKMVRIGAVVNKNDMLRKISTTVPHICKGFKEVKQYCKCQLNWSGQYWWGIRSGQYYFMVTIIGS